MNYRMRMRALREDRDLTQKEVGALINKSQQGYSHIEDGRCGSSSLRRRRRRAYQGSSATHRRISRRNRLQKVNNN